ncbi:MAG: response regulator [Cyclobacteriaceae bacterium]|nr:response regulator [Cyclobacteriaceae bacterium]
MDNLNNKGTILFVDDEQIVLDVGTMMIKKLGYRVLQATSGTEASQVFSDNIDDIGLVLLDINLPDEKGIDTCIRLKRMDSNVRVIHTSGMGVIGSGQTLDCGCAGFLAKPFNIEELSNKIKACFQRFK